MHNQDIMTKILQNKHKITVFHIYTIEQKKDS